MNAAPRATRMSVQNPAYRLFSMSGAGRNVCPVPYSEKQISKSTVLLFLIVNHQLFLQPFWDGRVFEELHREFALALSQRSYVC